MWRPHERPAAGTANRLLFTPNYGHRAGSKDKKRGLIGPQPALEMLGGGYFGAVHPGSRVRTGWEGIGAAEP